MLYESFLIIFELLELLRPPGCGQISILRLIKKSRFSSYFLPPDNFDLRFTPAFRKDLEPILCMRFSFWLNSNKKIVPAQTICQNMANFENSTPVSPKMSFFRKFKTSPALTPNYSIEPKKLCSTSHF